MKKGPLENQYGVIYFNATLKEAPVSISFGCSYAKKINNFLKNLALRGIPYFF